MGNLLLKNIRFYVLPIIFVLVGHSLLATKPVEQTKQAELVKMVENQTVPGQVLTPLSPELLVPLNDAVQGLALALPDKKVQKKDINQALKDVEAVEIQNHQHEWTSEELKQHALQKELAGIHQRVLEAQVKRLQALYPAPVLLKKLEDLATVKPKTKLHCLKITLVVAGLIGLVSCGCIWHEAIINALAGLLGTR